MVKDNGNYDLINDKLFECWQTTRDPKYLSQLIIVNMNLCKSVVKSIMISFDCSRYEEDDLINTGIEGFYNAIKTFDPTYKTKLATYATRCMRNAILNMLKKNNKERNDVSLNKLIDESDKDKTIRYEDILEDYSLTGDSAFDIYVRKELREEIEKAFKSAKLTKKQERVIRLKHGLDDGIQRKEREVAEILGTTRNNVKGSIWLAKQKILKSNKHHLTDFY